MTRAANPSLLRIAAWPSDILTDRKGSVWGFVMPRVATKQDIHELYSPKSRSEAFPEADFRLVVHVATNVAKAFATLHKEGHIVGDVNHGNLLVGPDGTVTLIDCDSFQVTQGIDVYTCDVGVPLFMAPELQGKTLRGLQRTENHDRFGLAVLLFHLLYMGRHPYAGRYDGTEEMPIERAIEEFRFAYGTDRRANRMERPPGTIPLEAMGAGIAELFGRAFARSGVQERPDAEAWVGALEKLAAGLRLCEAANWHHYPGHLESCPWCEVEAATGARLFGPKMALGGVDGILDLAAILAGVAAIPAPGPDPALPSERPWRPPPDAGLPRRGTRQARRLLRRVRARSRPTRQDRAVADVACARTRDEWERTLALWHRQATGKAFEDHRRSVLDAVAQLEAMVDERPRRMARLEAEREARQFQRYMDGFRIDRANIHRIGPSRTAMLASYGIETAADVDRRSILKIPGFNRVLANDLVRWRDRQARGFKLRPNEPVDRRDIDAMDRELAQRRKELLTRVEQAPTYLRAFALEIGAARQRLIPLLEDAWNAMNLAEAKRRAL
jgi:DNA-binding helix-hairpin-helix protein with protein kinase domain